jgi:hypothetical protein
MPSACDSLALADAFPDGTYRRSTSKIQQGDSRACDQVARLPLERFCAMVEALGEGFLS